MTLPSLTVFQNVEFLGFYLPPLALWMIGALAPYVIIRWVFTRLGVYRLVWHRSLFNLSLYVLLVCGAIFVGSRT
jgi:hypothetical protein